MPFVEQSTNGSVKWSSIQVRATIAILFSIGITVGFFMKLIAPEIYAGFANLALAFYFVKGAQGDVKENGNGDSSGTPKPTP